MRWPGRAGVVDGELVVLGPDGRSNFRLMQFVESGFLIPAQDTDLSAPGADTTPRPRAERIRTLVERLQPTRRINPVLHECWRSVATA